MASPFTAVIRGMDDWIAGPASLLDELARVKSSSRVVARVTDDESALEIEPATSRKPTAALSIPISPDGQAPAALRTAVNGKTVHLGIPASWMIARRVELPMEAASHVEGIVTSRMGALSPLPASDIYFGHRILGISHEARQITVAVAIVAKSRVAAALACLNAAEARQVVISAPLPEGDAVRVLTQRQRIAGTRGRIKFVLAGILGASLVAAVMASAVRPMIQNSYAERRAAVEMRAEKARQAIALAATPDKADTAPEQEALNIKDDAISALGALDDLAAALPTHSYAIEVSFANGGMRLSGRTRDVPEVLTALESSGRFEDSKLVGPALRGEDGVTSEFEVDTRPLIRTGGQLR
ncbi:PilN domain-containing protein [Phyllobacterium sp. 21LDTY02-6]|uniref:PilN domain-containing protein n=1 Tax=Phyllobacterium sp. 21LDTY02-6 TaxID=2944903 RepID=UPI0020213304|nr:PilN domain-containing protein [Phyllobacterium sp. 21LDTY02-6]MCO4318900.1 PilN domain-containing protein [Phyllobacterium sp. 21LDTY02-6]